MTKNSKNALIAVGIVAALIYTRRANAFAVVDNDLIIDQSAPSFPGWDGGSYGDPYFPSDFEGDSVAENIEAIRLGAFLYMLQCAETTERDAWNGTAYNRFYGMSLFSDMSDHPVLTGEKQGIKLPDDWCVKAGFSPGCISTAAGAYQINLPTWREVREAGTWGPKLLDFSPSSQDEAARRVLILAGALPFVESGDFDIALVKASVRWASLPGSRAGQGGKTYATVYGWYNSALVV